MFRPFNKVDDTSYELGEQSLHHTKLPRSDNASTQPQTLSFPRHP